MNWGLLVFAAGLPVDIIGLSMGSPQNPIGFIKTFVQCILLLWLLRKEFPETQPLNLKHTLSLLLLSALYSGVLSGALQYSAYNVIYPEFLNEFIEIYQVAFENGGFDSAQKEEATDLVKTLYQSPLFHVISASLGNMFTFGILGILFHFLAKRRRK